MPLIWNNKEYKLVAEDGGWNPLEFAVARKLRIQYKPTQVLSIDFIKKTFEIYGAIEKIEIFRSKIQFAHVTFKESRTAYLVLIDFKQNTPSTIELIRPADIHEQPDTPVDSSKSPLYNLPDDCLLQVFVNCEVNTLATLAVVCKRFSELLRDRVFGKKFKFECITANDMDVLNALITAGRLVQCINPAAFIVKIHRNLKYCHVWPTISVDFAYTDKSRLFIEMKFCKAQWLDKLEPISKRIVSIHIHCSIYDSLSQIIKSVKTYPKPKPSNGINNRGFLKFHNQVCKPVDVYNIHNHIEVTELPAEKPQIVANNPINQTNIWPNATILIVSGFSKQKSVPEFSSVVAALPKMETLSIRNLHFKWKIEDYCHGKHLRNIDFENCSFISDISEANIYEMVRVTSARFATKEEKKNIFPVCIRFDLIHFLNGNSHSNEFEFGMENSVYQFEIIESMYCGIEKNFGHLDLACYFDYSLSPLLQC